MSDLNDFVKNESFRIFYDGGLTSRFNARRLIHSLEFTKADSISYFTLELSGNNYKMLLKLSSKGHCKIQVMKEDSQKQVYKSEFVCKTSQDFLDEYRVPVNEYFPHDWYRT